MNEIRQTFTARVNNEPKEGSKKPAEEKKEETAKPVVAESKEVSKETMDSYFKSLAAVGQANVKPSGKKNEFINILLEIFKNLNIKLSQADIDSIMAEIDADPEKARENFIAGINSALQDTQSIEKPKEDESKVGLWGLFNAGRDMAKATIRFLFDENWRGAMPKNLEELLNFEMPSNDDKAGHLDPGKFWQEMKAAIKKALEACIP